MSYADSKLPEPGMVSLKELETLESEFSALPTGIEASG
jgi:hypothetical protein